MTDNEVQLSVAPFLMAYYKNQFRKLKSIKEIDRLSGEEFEWFCKFMLEEWLGYERVQVTKKELEGSKCKYDGGIDIIAHKDGETYLVQCKHWHEGGDKDKDHLGVRIVRELGGSMKEYEITHGFYPKGIVIATVPVFDITKKEAKILGIDLIDYSDLVEIMTTRVLNY